MYNRFLSQIYRPGFNSLTRIQYRGIKIPKDPKIITSVTDEYEKIFKQSENKDKKERDDRRKRIIRYLVYNPSPIQKLLILKARFFATGYIYVAGAFVTYVLISIIKAIEKWDNKERYGINRMGE